MAKWIKISNTGQELQANEALSLLENLLEHDVQIHHSCEGMGSCGTCRVFVQSDLDNLEDRNELESDIAEMREFSAKERLSCQLEFQGSITIEIPEDDL